MAFDEGLADRVREIIRSQPGYMEKKMFGGLCFLIHGNMACGITGDDLMVRAGAHTHEDLLEQPHTRAMDFTGRPMKGFVFVNPEGTAEDAELARWIGFGRTYAESLPPKK
ncbi:TfoX/Sxy family protein [Candidatus Neomarinimicrobiota bacterium]